MRVSVMIIIYDEFDKRVVTGDRVRIICNREIIGVVRDINKDRLGIITDRNMGHTIFYSNIVSLYKI